MKTDVLVVGAGFAGAAAAYHLSHDRKRSVLILDQEDRPGVHASGRNAALMLQASKDAPTTELVCASRLALEEISERIGFRRRGSLLLGSAQTLAAMQHPEWFHSELQQPDEARRRVPLLKHHTFESALWTPDDGVVEIDRFLRFYLEEAQARGAGLQWQTRVEHIEPGGPFRVTTSRGIVEASIVVNAAGAWAADIARQAGIKPPVLDNLRRHLFVVDSPEPPDPDWPFVWDFEENFYFRPDSGALLYCICDEDCSDTLDPDADPEIFARARQLLPVHLAGLREPVFRQAWACYRTKSPDGDGVIGWDPEIPGFFWIAGLWGHGMCASWEVGRRAARFISNPDSARPPHNRFAPERFH